VVRAAGLRLGFLALVVTLGHLLALEWLAREADAVSGLKLMVPPMYTRLLQPRRRLRWRWSRRPRQPARRRARAPPSRRCGPLPRRSNWRRA